MREVSRCRLRHSLLTAWLFLFNPVHAQHTQGALQSWQHTPWVVCDGAPSDVMVMEKNLEGVLWLDLRRGLYRFHRRSFSRVSLVLHSAGGHTLMRLRVYDAANSVEGSPLPAFLRLAATATEGGKPIFTTQPGLSQVDPFGPAPPPLPLQPTIRSIRADGEELSLSDPRLRPRPHTLEIEYSAVGLRDAQPLRYRYSLSGYDRNWQMAGTRNAALYTDLPPGRYFFQSQSSYDGVHWSLSSTTYAFRVPPDFSQRFSVRVAEALLLLAALFSLLRWRFERTYQRAQFRLQERVQERERIARDLHDTLLQGVQGLILRFGAIADSAIPDDAQRDNMQRALQLAERVIAEGRDRVRDLRKQSDDANRLEECLVEAGTILAFSSSSRFQWRTLGTKKSLPPPITNALFMIGREALQNAFQHAHAENVELRLEYSARDLTVSIRDNGTGLDSPTGNPALAVREAHWGLKGMRERADRIGAHFHLESRPGKGCKVQVSIAASLAYSDHVVLFRFPWLSKLRASWQRRTPL